MKLTDKSLVKRHEALELRISKLVSTLCDNGFGHLKHSELRQLANPPKFVTKYIQLVDESVSLRMEAELRYGPGLITVRQLIYK